MDKQRKPHLKPLAEFVRSALKSGGINRWQFSQKYGIPPNTVYAICKGCYFYDLANNPYEYLKFVKALSKASGKKISLDEISGLIILGLTTEDGSDRNAA